MKSLNPRELLGLSEGMVEGIYGQAYRFYSAGKFKEASQIFKLLIIINSSEPKYLMGYAACFHAIKDYKAAANAYSIVENLNPESPVAYFHSSDCYIQMGDYTAALNALHIALEKAGDKREHKKLRDRALIMCKGLENKLAA